MHLLTFDFEFCTWVQVVLNDFSHFSRNFPRNFRKGAKNGLFFGKIWEIPRHFYVFWGYDFKFLKTAEPCQSWKTKRWVRINPHHHIFAYHIKRWYAMNSLELTSAVTALANALSCRLTTSEISLIASIFVQLGDTLATIATQRSLCEERAEKNSRWGFFWFLIGVFFIILYNFA